MSYDYYCIYCGKKINQDGTEGAVQVLYDLSPILVGTEASFGNKPDDSEPNRITPKLKFRVPEKQLKEWAPLPNQACNVSFSPKRVFNILAQENNYNNREISDLTLEKIKNAEEGVYELFSSKKGGKMQSDENERQDAIDGLKKYYQTAEKENDHIISITLRRFEENGVTTKLGIEDSTGRTFKGGDIPRICPSCGKRVVPHAGAYPHHTVGFIANQDSGKTSTIIALTSYAKRAMAGLSEGRIWGKSQRIEEINGHVNPEQLKTGMSKDESTKRLQDDLDYFLEGFAPDKTLVKSKIVYNPTFFVTDNNQRSSLLTLVDIPGELCPREGDIDPDSEKKDKIPETKIKEDRMKDNYQIILSCDAYIVCFDQTIFRPDQYNSNNVNIQIEAPVKWAKAIQDLRHEVSPSRANQQFVPMMVLLTKCEEIEGEWTKPDASTIKDPWERAYMFAADYHDMMPSNNPKEEATLPQKIANEIRDKFSTYGGLDHTYYAMLRCSPFGFKADRKDKKYTSTAAEESKAGSKNGESVDAESGQEMRTTSRTGQEETNNWTGNRYPRNVDSLMKWILCVTGCIPTTGQYTVVDEDGCADTFSIERKKKPYYIGPQYRDVKPKDKYEALARRILFVNPGAIDRAKVEYQLKGFWLDRIFLQVKLKLNRKISNLSKEKL